MGQMNLWPDASFNGTRTRSYHRRDSYAVYLGTPQWKERKMEITQLQGYRCADCGSEERLHVHHEHYRTVRNEFPSDLVALCQHCHRNRHPTWA